MQRVEKNTPFISNKINFEVNKSKILPYSELFLNELYVIMQNVQNCKIKITGHTDNTGEKILNLKLSKNRAESIVNYLVKRGIPRNRFITFGYGDTKPIADNNNENGKFKNRRVEFEFVK